MIAESSRRQTVRQIGRFGSVGVANTLIDYTIFISLTKLFSLPLPRVWVAKLISGAVAMTFSYLLNKAWVFRHQPERNGRAAAKFVGVTLVGVFVIQLGLVQLFSSVFPQPGQWVYHILSVLQIVSHLPGVLTQALVIKTTAFILATLASLSWNYLAYRKVVFV